MSANLPVGCSEKPADMELSTADNDTRQLNTRREFMPAGFVEYRKPIAAEERVIPWQNAVRVQHSAISLVELRQVKVLCDARMVCIYDDVHGIYHDMSLESEVVDFDRFLKVPVRRIRGTTAMFPQLDAYSYYHWLIDTLPCIGVLEMAGHTVSEMDQLYIHRSDSVFQQKMLASLGIDQLKLLSYEGQRLHFEFEHLVLPFFRLDGAGWPHPWCAGYLKHELWPRLRTNDSLSYETSDVEDPTACRKLYVARGNARRRVLNEDALIEKLRQAGFSILDSNICGFEEQALMMNQSDLVLAAHGAGLANMVFCEPGTRIIEFGGHYLTTHFRMLSEYAELEYRSFAAGIDDNGKRLSVTPDGSVRAEDFLVDIEEVLRQSSAFADADRDACPTSS